MSQITVGEDILAVLIAVGLFSFFFLTLEDSFTAHRERQEAGDRAQLLLRTADFIRNGSIWGEDSEIDVGVLSQTALQRGLPQFIEKSNREGIKVQLEIISFTNTPLFKRGERCKRFDRSISLPVVYERENERIPARMVIWMGR